MVGPVAIPFGHVLEALAGNPADRVQGQIVSELRLPRVLLAAVIGACLAAAGTTLQAVMRSVLADPYILGVSSGASVGAALVVVTGLLTTVTVSVLPGLGETVVCA